MANNELSLSSLGIQLPYNMQAEQSVLGAALMDETILNRLITEMDPDMFYSEQNRAVYEEMRRLGTYHQHHRQTKHLCYLCRRAFTTVISVKYSHHAFYNTNIRIYCMMIIYLTYMMLGSHKKVQIVRRNSASFFMILRVDIIRPALIGLYT